MLRDVKDDIMGASWIDLLDEVHRASTCMEKNKLLYLLYICCYIYCYIYGYI